MADVSTSTRLIGGTLGWASTDGTLHRRVPVALRGIAGVTGTARGPIMLFDNTGEAYRASSPTSTSPTRESCGR